MLTNTTPTILVVDDESSLRYTVVRLLRSAGYTVFEADSGQAGLAMAQETTPDLILLDVVMPDLDGLAVCRQLKQMPHLAGMFVVLLSGKKISSRDQARGLEAGADGYIARPVSNQELLARVQSLLRLKHTESSLKAALRQQATLTRLSQIALVVTDLQQLFEEVVTIVADSLHLPYCKILVLQSDKQALRLQAGVGWPVGLVGQAMVEAGLNSQAGYTLQTQTPVVVTDLPTESRFSGPPLLTDHNIISGVSVIIGDRAEPYGVLGVHSDQQCQFSEDDVNFVQATANILASAVTRVNAEQARRESQARLESFFSYAPVGMVVLDLEWRYRSINPLLAQMNGSPVEAHYGKRVREILPKVGQTLLEPLFEQIVETGQPLLNFEQAAESPAAPGRLSWFSGSFFPIPGPDGQVSAIGGVIAEITEIKNSHQEAQRQRDFAMQVLNTMGQGLTVVDANSAFEYVNPAYAAMIGYRPEELIGKTPFDVTISEDHASLSQARDQRRRGNTSTYETRLRHREGHTVPVEITGVPHYATDEFLGSIAVITDLTERKRSEAALQRYADRLNILYQIGQSIITAKSEMDIVQEGTKLLHQLIQCQRVSTLLFDVVTQEVASIVVQPEGPTNLKAAKLTFHRADFEEKLQGKGWHIEDMLALPEPNDVEKLLVTQGIRTYVSVPVRSFNGLIGVLNLGADRPHFFNEETIEVAGEVAAQLGVAIQQARLQQQIRHHATSLEAEIEERTDELRRMVNLMAGREVRMAELKDVIRQLRQQVRQAGLVPVTDDPLMTNGELDV
ncbi:MAG: PAS domain S-box protein [Anaerolineae bacterium]|nr:PAS domain S-box protein [Anaerolineae bacterium]